MTGIRKNIYLSLIGRIKSEATCIRHISLWNENISNLSQESGYQLPAVFIEYEPILWKQGGQGAKTGTLRTRLHIVTETLSDPSDGSLYQDDALGIFDTIDAVVSSVTGLSGDGFNRFQHVEEIPDHNHDRIQHDVEIFTCEITDLRGVKQRHQAIVTNISIVPK